MSASPDPATPDPANPIPAPRYSPVNLLDRLPAHVEYAPHMLTDSDKAAPLWILSCFPERDTRIWRHVGATSLDLNAIVCESGWTQAELALIIAACSLTGLDAGAGLDLDELATRLDDERWEALLEAMRIRRAGLRGQL